MDENVTLYRPVGQKELDLIAASGFREFPPRLEGQPIFYPVLNEEYATFIARNWNTKDAASGFIGYVLSFRIRAEYLRQFEVQKVEARWRWNIGFPRRNCRNSIGTSSIKSK